MSVLIKGHCTMVLIGDSVIVQNKSIVISVVSKTFWTKFTGAFNIKCRFFINCHGWTLTWWNCYSSRRYKFSSCFTANAAHSLSNVSKQIWCNNNSASKIELNWKCKKKKIRQKNIRFTLDTIIINHGVWLCIQFSFRFLRKSAHPKKRLYTLTSHCYSDRLFIWSIWSVFNTCFLAFPFYFFFFSSRKYTYDLCITMRMCVKAQLLYSWLVTKCWNKQKKLSQTYTYSTLIIFVFKICNITWQAIVYVICWGDKVFHRQIQFNVIGK